MENRPEYLSIGLQLNREISMEITERITSCREKFAKMQVIENFKLNFVQRTKI
ncbi:hypothetical protein pv_357 [Pithovirus sibericum]|uniref:Uncharacterized protein n=1 Tax=Pithovirus sibericum TaxID=1450746 RepID=W5S5H8_9VIRU|nr:hypothetical protein pv_357 [Pithovirus sibericum]AHH01924.1 hypothetical protein pv_357 [Pithovirus sibericum]WIL05511.1 hypothetical protein pmam_472 [Pithovirus mammoth]